MAAGGPTSQRPRLPSASSSASPSAQNSQMTAPASPPSNPIVGQSRAKPFERGDDEAPKRLQAGPHPARARASWHGPSVGLGQIDAGAGGDQPRRPMCQSGGPGRRGPVQSRNTPHTIQEGGLHRRASRAVWKERIRKLGSPKVPDAGGLRRSHHDGRTLPPRVGWRERCGRAAARLAAAACLPVFCHADRLQQRRWLRHCAHRQRFPARASSRYASAACPANGWPRWRPRGPARCSTRNGGAHFVSAFGQCTAR